MKADYDEPNSEVVASALLLFVIAIVAVTLLLLLLSSNTNVAASLHQRARIVLTLGCVVAIIARDASRWICRLMIAQAKNVLSDIFTFPSHLRQHLLSSSQQKKRDGDDSGETGGVEVCHLILDGFYSLLSSSHSVTQNQDENSIDFFDFRQEGPPSQLHLQDLGRPPNTFLPSDFPAPASDFPPWNQFHAEVGRPWLWLHFKILCVFLFGIGSGIVDLFRFCIHLVFGGSISDELLPTPSWRFAIGVGTSYLLWATLFHYWLHAFCRCTSRVCARWDACFQEQGYSVEFLCTDPEAITTMRWSDLPLIPFMRVGKCYLRFRRRGSSAKVVGSRAEP